mmetsp:Transcript_40006/g.61209  ORF Transcript_40006/g.61209 Transcript_40006/m.61209 type:complete len:107 (+) Transcript_40006:445-765(+)
MIKDVSLETAHNATQRTDEERKVSDYARSKLHFGQSDTKQPTNRTGEQNPFMTTGQSNNDDLMERIRHMDDITSFNEEDRPYAESPSPPKLGTTQEHSGLGEPAAE